MTAGAIIQRGTVKDPYVGPPDTRRIECGINRAVLTTMSGRNKCSLPIDSSEHDVTWFVADPKCLYHSWWSCVDVHNDDAIGEVIDDPDLAGRIFSECHWIHSYGHRRNMNQ